MTSKLIRLSLWIALVSTLITASLLSRINYRGYNLGSDKAVAAVGINKKINFQGKVTNLDGTNVADGTYSFVFSIYTVASAGANIWTETQSLTTTSGVFQASLGTSTALPGSVSFNTDNIYLGINFNSNGEMTPRVQFTASPYAFNSDLLDGLDATGFIQNTTTPQSANIAVQSAASGNIAVLLKGAVSQSVDYLKVTDSSNVVLAEIDSAGNFIDSSTGTSSFAGKLAVGTTAVTAGASLEVNGDQYFSKEANRTIKVADSTTSSVVGGNLTVQAGAATTGVANGGALNLNGGASAGTATGGAVNITGGLGLIGGKITINGGSGISSSGDLQLQVGSYGGFVSIGDTASGTNLLHVSQVATGRGLATTNGSTTLTGSGTLFTSQLKVGDTITVTGETVRTITAITSDTSLTVSVAFNTTASSLSWTTTGGTRFDVQGNGNVGIGTVSPSANLQVVSNASGNTNTIFSVDQDGANTNNVITNPSFEAGNTNLTARTGCTLTNDTANSFNGNRSAKCVNTATANAGVNMAATLASTTSYSFSVYVNTPSPTFSTLEIGRSENGSTDTPCLTAQKVNNNGWTKYQCSFKTGTVTGSPYVYIRQTDATVRTFYVDALLLQTDANYQTNYRDSQINLGGTITSPVVMQNNTNSSNAFAIQNASGGQIFSVDTTDENLLANPSYETNITGWAAKGAGTIARDTSQAQYGAASLLVTTPATITTGASYTLVNSLPAATYTMSFSARNSGTIFANAPSAGYNNGSDVPCTVVGTGGTITGIPVTTGWTRFSCTFTTTGTTTSIYITQNEATIHTFNIDAVQLENGSLATTYGLGGISLSAVINTPVSLRNQSDSTTALLMQNTAGGTVLQVDTINNRLYADSVVALSGNFKSTDSVTNNSTAVVLQSGVGAGGSGGTSGAVTVQSGPAAFTTNGNTGAVTVDSGTKTGTGVAGAVNIGNTNSLTIGIGNASSTTTFTGTVRSTTFTSASTLAVTSASGSALSVNPGGAGALTLGTASTGTVQIGNTTGNLTVTAPTSTTTTGGIIIGTADASQTNLVLDNNSTYLDVVNNCTSTVNNGAIYYNSTSNSVRQCEKDTANSTGTWEDMVSTSGMGLLLFGVVPDSGTTANQGDINSTTAGTAGPCKVFVGTATTTISWNACIAYSGGRRVVVAAGANVATTNSTIGNFQHLCLNTASTNQPALTASAAENAGYPTFSANNPIFCIADIKFAAANNTITEVFDTRTYTTTSKSYANVVTTAPANGMMVKNNGTTASQYILTAAAGDRVLGVVVAAANNATASTINAIIATQGPVNIKSNGTATVGDFIGGSTTAGYAATVNVASASVYANAGVAANGFTSTCAISSDGCRGSIFTILNPK